MRLLILSLVMLSATVSHAIEVIDFRPPEVFRSTYVEEKHIPSLAAPLKSTGDFIYIRDRGIAWIMSDPFSMQTVITPRGVNLLVEGEKQPQSAEVRKAMIPILQNISAIFAGDFDALETQYEINKIQGNGIFLTPKSQYLKQYLQEIIIYGAMTIEKIKIVHASDKFTVTTFGNPIIGISHITDAEIALFDK